MAFKYTYTPNTKISDIFNSLKPASTVPFTTVTRTLPNNTGTYQSPVVAQPTAPVAPPTVPVPSKAPAVAIQTTQPQPTQPATPALDYSKYTDPTTGQVMTPQQYADFLAKRVTGGSVPNYAGNAVTQGPQTTAQLTSTATDLNNQANDIATGTTDPYKVASKSGIAYSPTELAAIEKAYAGIYDPALKDVFAKLDQKQKEDAAALDQKNKLAQMAQQHQYDLELKRTPTASESLAGSSGTYVPGANPEIDNFAELISSGKATIANVPSKYRLQVGSALQALGNQPDGRPTTTEIGLQTLDVAKRLKEMFDAGKGTSTVGASRLFGGGIATPGSNSANFVNLFNTLIANKSLEGVKFLKGQGQVSDAERLLLKNAMSELNLNQSEGEFKKSLQAIIDKLEGNSPSSSGASTGFDVTDPDGGVHSFPTQAAADEFKKAIGQ